MKTMLIFLNDFEHGKFTKNYNIKIDKYLLQINYSIDVASDEDNVFPIQLPQHNNNVIITTAQTTKLPQL